MKYGFVYCLWERVVSQPLQDRMHRALANSACREEISRGTGVPSSLGDLLHRVRAAGRVERDIHRMLSNYRPNNCRSFLMRLCI